MIITLKRWAFGDNLRALFYLFITNILFGNYRLPIKIYYICSHTVDKKKHPAVGTVFLVAKGRFCMRRKCLDSLGAELHLFHDIYNKALSQQMVDF